MTQNINDIKLPKWPALVVVGDDVTKDQAKEILIRTTSTYLRCNDGAWNKIVALAFGISADPDSDLEWDIQEAVFKGLGVLDLIYLTNNRIASSYVYGPTGWCDWSGKIGCNNFNVGKWPTVEYVTNDWKTIAAAFPFLNLKAQLFNGEHCEDNLKPLVEFQIKNGEVSVTTPTEAIGMPWDSSTFPYESVLFSDVTRERGCTREILVDAIDFVRNKDHG